MEERVFVAPPSPGASATSTCAAQEKRPILSGITESATANSTASFAQPIISDSWKNGHVRQPSSPAKRRVESQLSPNRGHKRTATGDIKTVYTGSKNQISANGVSGRARTMSLDSTGSKIAELSAQLRSRLSYAAAKVEKNWRIQQAGSMSNRMPKSDGSQNTGDSAIRSRLSHNASPEGTIISAPETSSTRALYSIEASERTRSSMPPQTTVSLQQSSKLAPPVDIISANNPHPARRRPNPNDTNNTSSYSPHSSHRRYHSQQERRTHDPNLATVYGTPFLNSSSQRPNDHAETSNLSPLKRRTPSQNALMEQDAIETLLFMSSPENSGYHANSQPRQTNVSVSIEAQIESSQNGNTQTSSQESGILNARNVGMANFLNSASGVLPATSINLEAQAGDEIDRLLDQMEAQGRHDSDMQLSSYDFASLGSQDLGPYETYGLNGPRE